MSKVASVLSLDQPPWPPSVDEFFPPGLFGTEWLTKFMLMVWLAIALIIIFFLVAYRNPKIVPGRGQWLAESIYGFTRDGIAKEVIGHDGVRFAPYLTTLLVFIAITNLFAVIPLLQISPNSHIAFPAMLTIVTFVLYLYWGVKTHGAWGYLKMSILPPDVPWPVYLIVTPIELAMIFVIRPFTLAVRLFANMFAGHMMLLVFTIGGFLLLNAEALFLKPVSILSWGLTIVLVFFETLVALLQAYVFVLLTSSYLQSSLAEEH